MRVHKAWYTLFVSRDWPRTPQGDVTVNDKELIDAIVHDLVDDAENALDFVDNVRKLLARVPTNWGIGRTRNALHELNDDIQSALEAAADTKDEAGGW